MLLNITLIKIVGLYYLIKFMM